MLVKKNCCGPCQNNYDVGTMMPNDSYLDCNTNKCGAIQSSTSGIVGTSLNSNQQLVCPGIYNSNQPKNYCTPPKNNFNYYPFNKKYGDIGVTRLASPSGGIPLTGGDSSHYN